MTEPMMIPYPGMGSGHAGNDTSRERQERNDASGVTAKVQQLVLVALTERRTYGMTCAELCDTFDIGEGQGSSAFSHLHRAGHIKRIKERRQRHEVYVMPEFVGGREESPYRPRIKAVKPADQPDAVLLAAMEKVGIPLEALAKVRAFLKELP